MIYIQTPTIYDIAKLAGVSPATVSRVLNNIDYPMKDKTKQKVLNAMAELRYFPNTIAQSLSRGRTNTIGIIVPSITNDFYTNFVDLIESELEENGYTSYLCNTHRLIDKETAYINNLIARKVDGVVIAPTRAKPEDNEINVSNIKMLRANNIPVVAFGSSYRGVSQIQIDSYSGIYESTVFLIKRGHKRIGFIDGLNAGTKRNRFRGFCDAMKDFALQIDESFVSAGDLSVDAGFRIGKEMLSAKASAPTAIITANNLMAIGVLRAANKLKINVPGELSVIGYDDSSFAEIIQPALTVTRVPFSEISSCAVKLLLKQIINDEAPESITLKPSMMLRESH